MTAFEFKPIQREHIPLILGLAGGTGSGKTNSALRLARGIAQGQPFACIDTENGRMGHYAEDFPEAQSLQIVAPYRPSKYADALEAAEAHLTQLGVPLAHQVIVVDSASHEWYGDGGCLEWQEEIMDGRESRRAMSWIEPKKAHRRYMMRLVQRRCHVILCFRAEPKIDIVDDPDKPGKTKVVAKQAPQKGLDGWIPVAQPQMPYELTASFLLMADAPGVPRPIKLEGKHRPLVPLGEPLTEDVGVAWAKWAAGDLDTTEQIRDANEALVVELLDLAAKLGKKSDVQKKVEEHRGTDSPDVFSNWLRVQIKNATAAVNALDPVAA